MGAGRRESTPADCVTRLRANCDYPPVMIRMIMPCGRRRPPRFPRRRGDDLNHTSADGTSTPRADRPGETGGASAAAPDGPSVERVDHLDLADDVRVELRRLPGRNPPDFLGTGTIPL
ncbi:hypothetical protein GCM10010219_48600 [Streptomyces netropsis]|nr:hypothetical protein GCM10010219_48600 [Streptomyces netropsis]